MRTSGSLTRACWRIIWLGRALFQIDTGPQIVSESRNRMSVFQSPSRVSTYGRISPGKTVARGKQTISTFSAERLTSQESPMARRYLADLSIVVVVAVGAIGCSDPSPVAPSSGQPDLPEVMARLAPVSGVYDLTFLSQGQPVTSLTVRQQVILKAHVQNT